MSSDEQQLKLLSVFHYVVAGMAGLFSLLPIFHLVFGLFLVFAPETFEGNGEAPPGFFGWIFVIFAAVFMALGFAFAALVLLAGRSLSKRRHHLFCVVMGGVECLFMPFGTVLGVFTIIVLMRQSVKALFNADQ